MTEADPEVTNALKKLKITQVCVFIWLARLWITIAQSYVLGVDVGGTNTRVAVGTPDGEYVIVAKFLSRTVAQLTSGLDKLVGMLESYCLFVFHYNDFALLFFWFKYYVVYMWGAGGNNHLYIIFKIYLGLI